MAKASKKNPPRVYSDPDEIGVSGGVKVSSKGVDKGPEHLHRKEFTCTTCGGKGTITVYCKPCPLCQGTGKLAVDPEGAESMVADMLQATATDKRASVSKRVDHIERLWKAKEIDKREQDAALDYAQYFYQGNLHALQAAKLEWSPPATGERITKQWMQARDKVMEATAAMGGHNHMMSRAAWGMLGEGKSLREMADGDRNEMHKWDVVLKCAITIIANTYYPIKKKN